MGNPGHTSRPIKNLDDLLDNVIHFANEHQEHNTDEFMKGLHNRILLSVRDPDPGATEGRGVRFNDRVTIAYFRIYAILRQKTTSRTRIISTAQSVVDWVRQG